MDNERDVEFTPTPGGLDQSTDTSATPTRDQGSFDATRGIGAAAGTASGPSARTGEGIGATGSRDSSTGMGDAPANMKDRAKEVKDRAADEVESRISEQKHRAADSLGDIAQSLRTAGRQLPDDNGMGQYVLKAANQVDNLASALDNREVAELVDGVEDFARRQPAAFIGSAFAIGMIGARFLKSSRRDLRDDAYGGQWNSRQLPEGFDSAARDAVSRPDAPGYAPPSSRDITGDATGGYS